jgi:hypothetical protein
MIQNVTISLTTPESGHHWGMVGNWEVDFWFARYTSGAASPGSQRCTSGNHWYLVIPGCEPYFRPVQFSAVFRLRSADPFCHPILKVPIPTYPFQR